MKRIIMAAILMGLGALAFKTWESPYFSLYRINEGLKARDPVAVERYVDLEAMVKASAAATGALASEGIGAGGADAGSKVVGALVDAVAKGVGEAVSVQGAMEFRRAIQEGRVVRGIGPFTVKEGFGAWGPMEVFQGETALVELHGTCRGNDASVVLRFSRRDGPFFGRPWRFVMSGVDEPSVRLLAKRCR